MGRGLEPLTHVDEDRSPRQHYGTVVVYSEFNSHEVGASSTQETEDKITHSLVLQRATQWEEDKIP